MPSLHLGEQKPSYALTIGRSLHGGEEKRFGEHEGWLHVVNAKDGSAGLLDRPRKFWMVLEGAREP